MSDINNLKGGKLYLTHSSEVLGRCDKAAHIMADGKQRKRNTGRGQGNIEHPRTARQ
jgi:hypothetical protein